MIFRDPTPFTIDIYKSLTKVVIQVAKEYFKNVHK